MSKTFEVIIVQGYGETWVWALYENRRLVTSDIALSKAEAERAAKAYTYRRRASVRDGT